MIYYIYSHSIARSDGVKLEIKNHRTNLWREVVDPHLWKRIQEEGIEVTEKEAEEMYRHFKKEKGT